MNTINTAMIFAAGLGTRLKPFTNSHPKALAQVNGISLLSHNISYLKQFGITKIIINVHHFASQIIAEIKQHNNWDINIIISDETDEVLETGGGLLKAKSLLGDAENFVVMNVDMLTNLNLNDMIVYHFNKKSLATLAVSERETSRYFLFDEELKLCGWKNIKTGEIKGLNIAENALELSIKPLAFSGIHIINKSFFELNTLNGKFSMVDAYLNLLKENSLYGFNHTGCKLIDVGKPESIAQAEALFA